MIINKKIFKNKQLHVIYNCLTENNIISVFDNNTGSYTLTCKNGATINYNQDTGSLTITGAVVKYNNTNGSLTIK